MALTSWGTGEPDETVRWSLDDLPCSGEGDSDRTRHGDSGSAYRTIARADGVSVVDVRCQWTAGATYSERFQGFGVSLVRRGLFVRKVGRSEQVVDSTRAYFEQPSVEQVVCHPLPTPGRTTVIVLSASAMARYAGDVSMPDRLIPVEPAVQVDHAVLLSDARVGIDGAELDARLAWLVGRLVETASPGRLSARRPATVRSHLRIVDRVRGAIAAEPAALDLSALASGLGHTPFHVSRVFHRVTGTTLTQHRNRVRVAAAIDRIADGQRLADVAVALGFADQSHLARVLQRSAGLAPGRLRERLTARADETARSGQRRPRPAPSPRPIVER